MKWTIEAVVKNGVICPQEPLPPEWAEGAELAVQLVSAPKGNEDDVSVEEELTDEAAGLDQEDWEEFQASLDRMHRDAKDMVRRQMGLP